MTNDYEKSYERKYEHRQGIFFPLLLVAVGLLFLLGTLGIIPGGTGAGFIKYWPVLLIIMGLDSFYRHDGGYVGATLILGMGIIFLLGNLGYLEVTPWQVVLQFWPALLVAAGLDLIVGRRSFWSLMAGIILGGALVAGIFWMGLAAPLQSSEAIVTTISQEKEDVRSATLHINPIAGNLNISSGAGTAYLLEGSLTSKRDEEIRQTYNDGIYRLEGSNQPVYPFFVWGPSSPYRWDLKLTTAIPLDLETQLLAGSQAIELDGLDISNLDVETVMGETRLILSEENQFDGKTNGVFGSLVLLVPEGLPVHVVEDCAICSVDAPPDFERDGKDIWSPGARNESQVELRVNLVFGTLRVEYLP